jgi:hypothetical protein
MAYKNSHRLAALALAMAAGLAFPGCGGDWKADTAPASGRVTINGKPAAGLIVELHPTGPPVDARNSRSWGKVQEDGSFTLSAYEDRDGVPPGEYAITLTWPVDSSVFGSPDRLGRRYDKPEKSEWKASIKTGGPNVLPPIELTNVAVNDKPRQAAPSKEFQAP